jgi:cytidylate kinase
VDYGATLREISERDQRDASRDVAPMVAAPDAVLVDSSVQTLEEVVDSLARLVEARQKAAAGI